MNKKVKSILIAGAIFVTSAALAIGGSLAYLVDTDKDKNVMTLGKIEIDQIEQERVDPFDDAKEHELQAYTQNKPLYPAYFVGSGIPYDDPANFPYENDVNWTVTEDNKNVIDKFVTVENTGKNDVYVRTIFAFEEHPDKAQRLPYIHILWNNSDDTYNWNYVGVTEIDGTPYELWEAVYVADNGILEAGDTTVPSLKQVYMDPKADNDYVYGFGETYDILVFSEAVQADSFAGSDLTPEKVLDIAFYDVTTDAHPWISVTTETTAETAAVTE